MDPDLPFEPHPASRKSSASKVIAVPGGYIVQPVSARQILRFKSVGRNGIPTPSDQDIFDDAELNSLLSKVAPHQQGPQTPPCTDDGLPTSSSLASDTSKIQSQLSSLNQLSPPQTVPGLFTLARNLLNTIARVERMTRANVQSNEEALKVKRTTIGDLNELKGLLSKREQFQDKVLLHQHRLNMLSKAKKSLNTEMQMRFNTLEKQLTRGSDALRARLTEVIGAIAAMKEQQKVAEQELKVGAEKFRQANVKIAKYGEEVNVMRFRGEVLTFQIKPRFQFGFESLIHEQPEFARLFSGELLKWKEHDEQCLSALKLKRYILVQLHPHWIQLLLRLHDVSPIYRRLFCEELHPADGDMFNLVERLQYYNFERARLKTRCEDTRSENQGNPPNKLPKSVSEEHGNKQRQMELRPADPNIPHCLCRVLLFSQIDGVMEGFMRECLALLVGCHNEIIRVLEVTSAKNLMDISKLGVQFKHCDRFTIVYEVKGERKETYLDVVYFDRVSSELVAKAVVKGSCPLVVKVVFEALGEEKKMKDLRKIYHYLKGFQ